ncbi:MAG: DivIVA domain-containing protein [Eubacteriales bacterium]
MPKTFPVLKKGYDPQEVDNYISKLEQELNDFKQREQAISHAIMDAQVTSKKIVKAAKDEAGQIQKEAILQLDSIRRKVSYIKQKIETFQASYNQFIERFTVNINQDDINKLYHQLDELSNSLRVDESTEQPIAKPNLTKPNDEETVDSNENEPTQASTENTKSDEPDSTKAEEDSKSDLIDEEEDSPFMGMGGFNSNLFTID